MHQMSASTFGIGTPFATTIPGTWGLSPQTAQGLGFQSIPQSYSQQTPWSVPLGAYGTQPLGAFGAQNQPFQLLQQLLSIVPQQLQQIQQLQQQQLVYLQQLLQSVPLQLHQLQQLVQTIPQQFQQQWQPFTTQGPLGFGFTPQVGLSPQVYGGQVM